MAINAIKRSNVIKSKILNNLSFLLLCICICLFITTISLAEEKEEISQPEATSETIEDLHLSGPNATLIPWLAWLSYKVSENRHIIVFQNGCKMVVANNEFSSDKAVIWIENSIADANDDSEHIVTAYLHDKVQVRRNGQTIPNIDDSKTAFWFRVNGELLITSNRKQQIDPRGFELYKIAYNTLRGAEIIPDDSEIQPVIAKTLPSTSVIQASELAEPEEKQEPEFNYPITLSAGDEKGYVLEVDKQIATVIGKFYLSQKQEEDGETSLLELQANNAVIFLPEEKTESNETSNKFYDILDEGVIKAIYLSGDVVMTEGQRTIRADEIFYDYQQKKAIVINAVMRNFDTNNGIPIYIRASKLQQVAANKFAAENAVLTTSEFYLPQISLNASSIIITDNTMIDNQQDSKSPNNYEVLMDDVSLKYYDTKFPLLFPHLRANSTRPDVPIKDIHIGNDNTFGTYIETNWYLTRILGLEEPEGTDSTLSLDYYSERGIGGGVETEYERDNSYGRFLGYIIDDDGQDRLGRIRKNLEPSEDTRGRLFWQHRQFLPYKWQLTTEIGYLSDENFLESFYRKEFNLYKPQETLIHMKRSEENWALSFLGKARINDFENELEQLPTAEFHWTGQSLFDDKFTFYSDTQMSRLRQRYGSGTSSAGTGDFYSYLMTRNEIDMPISLNKAKIVPFLATTTAFEDGMGFYSKLDETATHREDFIFIGEAGIRASTEPFWKVFPDVDSQLWDLNQLRHTVQPHLTAAAYMQDESVAEQRDTISVGITQRLQTKRGFGSQKRTVDWMRLDMDLTWVNNSGDSSAGADQLLWNKPFIPLINENSILIPQQDRRGTAIYGPRRNYFSSDYIWNISDTTAFLSDMNYDLQSGVVQQLNFGFSRMRQPNLSYYVGNRYLRRLDNGYGQQGSNAFTFALTYMLDQRYTLVYAGQFDLDYGATVRNDLTLIKRYHRLFWSLTYSNDESMDRHSIAFSLWPQGIPDLAFGPSRYMELGGSAGF